MKEYSSVCGGDKEGQEGAGEGGRILPVLLAAQSVVQLVVKKVRD